MSSSSSQSSSSSESSSQSSSSSSSRTTIVAFTSIEIVYNNENKKYLLLNAETESVLPYHLELATDSNKNIESNEIRAGVAKSDSINWEDYYNDSQPLIENNGDGKTVIPIRSSFDTSKFDNEYLNKIDSFTLKFEYGDIDPYSSVSCSC